MSKNKPTNYKQRRDTFASFSQKAVYVQTLKNSKKATKGFLAALIGKIASKRTAVRKTV